MLLIADGGSTKTDWVLIDENACRSNVRTEGFNPFFTDAENIQRLLAAQLLPQLSQKCIDRIIFYGAGCSDTGNVNTVKTALEKFFPESEINVEHDMLAAARALLGNSCGFAAILGTGSNSCIYNGSRIERNIESLGYLLGDEGSGSSISKKIVRDFMRGLLPAELEGEFRLKYGLNNAQIFKILYENPQPNKFLAGFCRFAHEHKQHPYIRGIVKESFREFFRNLVTRYPGFNNYKFNCVGSVGSVFKEELLEIAQEHRMQAGNIIASPINDLVNYHLRTGGP